MSFRKPQKPWGLGNVSISVGPALLVLGAALVRWLGTGEWPAARIDALGRAERVVAAIVISLSVLGAIDTLRVNFGRVGWAWVGNGRYVKILNLYGLYGLALLYVGWTGIRVSQAEYLLWSWIGVMVLGGFLVLIPVIILLAVWFQDSPPTSAAPLYEPRNKSRACKRP